MADNDNNPAFQYSTGVTEVEFVDSLGNFQVNQEYISNFDNIGIQNNNIENNEEEYNEIPAYNPNNIDGGYISNNYLGEYGNFERNEQQQQSSNQSVTNSLLKENSSDLNKAFSPLKEPGIIENYSPSKQEDYNENEESYKIERGEDYEHRVKFFQRRKACFSYLHGFTIVNDLGADGRFSVSKLGIKKPKAFSDSLDLKLFPGPFRQTGSKDLRNTVIIRYLSSLIYTLKSPMP